jgi:sporulation protein YlmC with PRC-barrel domain
MDGACGTNPPSKETVASKLSVLQIGARDILAETWTLAKPCLNSSLGDKFSMPEILASALHEKPVLTTDGRELGTVYNLTMEQRTGKLDTLLVDPIGDGFKQFETTDDGYLRIPAAMINSLDDQLMVTLPERVS